MSHVHASEPMMDSVEILAAEHRNVAHSVGRFHRQLLRLRATGRTTTAWVRRAIAFMENYAVAVHSAREDSIVFPVLWSKPLEERDREVLRVLAAEHSFVGQCTAELDAVAKPVLAYRPNPALLRGAIDLLNPLMEFFTRHLRREEDDLYPLIKTYLNPEERAVLSRQLLGAHSKGNTRHVYTVGGSLLPLE